MRATTISLSTLPPAPQHALAMRSGETSDGPSLSSACSLSPDELVRTVGSALGRGGPRGMSLLEIMVVITLIGLVTAAVGVAVIGTLEEGQVDVARQQASELDKAVRTYVLRVGRYPSTAEGLAALASPPRGRPVVERLPVDPWGNPYTYVHPGRRNAKSFDISSAGPDGQHDTDDDVGNWPAGT